MWRGMIFILMLLLIPACTRRIPKKPFTFLFQDDFNRGDQVLSATSAWIVDTPSGSALTILNTLLRPLQGSGNRPSAFYYNQVGLTDSKVMVDISVQGGTMATPQMKIAGRYDTTDLASATHGYLCGFDGHNNIVILRNDTEVQSGTQTFNFEPNDFYTLTFIQEGNLITCEAESDDGTSDVIYYSEQAAWSDGYYFGITGGVATTNYAYFDNFRVYGK